jgi:hypothetical protein
MASDDDEELAALRAARAARSAATGAQATLVRLEYRAIICVAKRL